MSMLFYMTASTFIYIYNEHAVLSDSNLFYSLSLCTAAATRGVLKMRDDERNRSLRNLNDRELDYGWLYCMLNKIFNNKSLSQDEMSILLDYTYGALSNEKALLKLKPPLLICGDIHGQYYDLVRMFEKCGWPPKKRYLFLGDYVDRGAASTEVITMLFLFKVLYPNDFFLLRGNHECEVMNKKFGFYKECLSKHSAVLFQKIQLVFDWLPAAAIVSDKIFCVHGGPTPALNRVDFIDKSIQRPTSVQSCTLLNDMLWSDPVNNNCWYKPRKRRAGYMYGESAIKDFCKFMDVDLVVRAHENFKEGFRFFGNKKLITVSSIPNYCGHENASAVLQVDENLRCTILQFFPILNR
ncbi:Serine/threonine-protein phosphatase PP1-1 [Trichinella nelsoni]|uniref:Serine/threonine-protein phosphatase n=1 Tax=Trichinella nelsoni TaxID=6336 RepID=A0A0V0S382_9BILA|nr:Serine/threonine-protein phosphatase PP1-1 [Trichinella nelsoni]